METFKMTLMILTSVSTFVVLWLTMMNLMLKDNG